MKDLNKVFPKRGIQFKKRLHKYVDPKTKQELCSVTTWVKSFFQPFEDTQAYKNANDYIKKIWAKSGTAGTKTHKQIEKFILDGILPTDLKAQQAVPIINRIDKGAQIYPELKIYSTKLGLAGTSDLVIVEDGVATIFDWKTNKAIYQTSRDGLMAKKPLEAFPDCNYYQYLLQLSAYAYILALKGIKIKHCELVHLQEHTFMSYKFLPRLDLIKAMLEEKDGYEVISEGNK
jgi:ATP-dependent exoDNAse (exonuclease V) beta subunit